MIVGVDVEDVARIVVIIRGRALGAMIGTAHGGDLLVATLLGARFVPRRVLPAVLDLWIYSQVRPRGRTISHTSLSERRVEVPVMVARTLK